MEPKEKANELYNYYFQIVADNYKPEITAKELALYFIDSALDLLCSDRIIYGSEYRNEESEYWNEAKNQLNNL